MNRRIPFVTSAMMLLIMSNTTICMDPMPVRNWSSERSRSGIRNITSREAKERKEIEQFMVKASHAVWGVTLSGICLASVAIRKGPSNSLVSAYKIYKPVASGQRSIYRESYHTSASSSSCSRGASAGYSDGSAFSDSSGVSSSMSSSNID